MRDGQTRKMQTREQVGALHRYLDRYDPKIVALTGRDAGSVSALRSDRVTFGRGPGVDVTFDDPAMSRQHAALEFTGKTFRIRDLGSTNGLLVNGNRVQACELEHGDRFEMGGQVFQFVLDERDSAPDVYELTTEA
jgi:pSer/pThr/pTyr-binding forkhead associated (FHA) protein